MRLAAQAKAGFYPAHPDAISLILKHLQPPDEFTKRRANETLNVIDPCAGEGVAIKQIAEGVGAEAVYAVELDAGRAGKLRENLQGAEILAPCSFIGTSITGYCFSLAYVNPPFDNELGGGRREEATFIEKATHLVARSGVLVAVMPLKTLTGSRSLCEFIDARYEHVCVYKFPDHCRPFTEIVVIGSRRKDDLPQDSIHRFGDLTGAMQIHYWWGGGTEINRLPTLGQPQPLRWVNGQPSYERKTEIEVWPLGYAWKPHRFQQCAFTDEELAAKLDSSPLNRLLREVEIPPPKRPPLPLNKGHVALLLASGMLDGLVETPDGNHVVRGTATKTEYISKRETTENEDTGVATEKVVYSQKIVLKIRAVDDSGVIRTFADEPPPEAEADPDEPAEVESLGAIKAKATFVSSESPAYAKANADLAAGAISQEIKAIEGPAPASPASWKFGVKTNGDVNWAYNGCRYKTKEDAEAAARDLFARWTAVREWQLEESDEPANR